MTKKKDFPKEKGPIRLGPFSPQDHLVITTLGLEFAVAVALGVGGGFWIDTRFSSAPWGMVGGVFCGFALGMYILIKESRRLSQEEKNKEQK